jgi:hypothetical protein
MLDEFRNIPEVRDDFFGLLIRLMAGWLGVKEKSR